MFMPGFSYYKHLYMKYNTFAPLFPGFYNTVFEYSNEDEDIKDYNEREKTDYTYDNFTFDYKEYETRIAKAFVNRLERELNVFLSITIEFQEVISPKEYNFRNDSINIAVDLELSVLIELIRNRYNEAKQYFKSTYTSCSGFISSHSNDIQDWLNPEYILSEPEHRIGALLSALCFSEIDQDNIIYWCDDESHIDFELKPA